MLKKVTILIILSSICLFKPIFAQESKTIHVLVALCDNKYQGIVKVPKAIGNGQDPNSNLYWGCGYGVRTYFKKSADWKEISRSKVDSVCLERIVFKHKTKDYYLIADAYDGRYIKQCTIDLLNSCSGAKKDLITADGQKLGLFGNAEVLTYIGHNGLMDFRLQLDTKNRDGNTRQVMIYGCYVKQYFKDYVKASKANPLVWSTHLMSPEAYSLHAALAAYLDGKSDEEVAASAAGAYSKYQKCSLKAAKRLLVTGY